MQFVGVIDEGDGEDWFEREALEEANKLFDDELFMLQAVFLIVVSLSF